MSESRWSPSEAGLGQLWAAAVEAAGGTARGMRTTYLDVQRTGTTVAAEVEVEWPDGRHTTETFGAGTSKRARAALRMSDGVHEIGVWRFPYDPALPGLPAAHDPRRMRALVTRLGLAADDVRLAVRTYRPLRRAVVEVRTARASVFVKVLRPDHVEALHRLHRAAAGSRVPESLGWTDDGLLVLSGLRGRSLRRILLSGDPSALDPAELVEMLRTLPPAFAEHAVRRGWAERARHYADVVAAVVPEAGPAAHAIADAALPSAEPRVPVHGDFYETQLLVSGSSFTGLLDIDTAGAGDRYDDPACLLGHLAVLARVRPDRAAVIDRFASRCLREFDRHWDPYLLRTRVAAVVLSLATGAHRVQAPGWREVLGQRLELAERWCRGEELVAA